MKIIVFIIFSSLIMLYQNCAPPFEITEGSSAGVINPDDKSTTEPGGENQVSLENDMERANSYDNAWETDWVANAKTILATTVKDIDDVNITKTAGKVLQGGDSMSYSYAYGNWARGRAGASTSDITVMDWMHSDEAGTINGWNMSSGGVTAWNNSNWGAGWINNLTSDVRFKDAQFAVLMFNVNNIDYVRGRVNNFIAAGIVPVLSTIPPRVDGDLTDNFSYNRDKAEPYNAALYSLAEELSLPIIDYYKEINLRRPNGTWEKTLIGNLAGTDGVHPTGGVNGYNSSSSPYIDGGDVSTHTTGDATLNSGYVLRTWLVVQKMKEIKEKVVD